MLPALLGGPGASSLEWATRRWEADVLENQNQGLVRGWKGGGYGLFQPRSRDIPSGPLRRLQLEACRHPVGFPASLSEIKKRGTGWLGCQFKKGMDSSRKGRFGMCSGWGRGPGGTRCWAAVLMRVLSHTVSSLKNVTGVALERFVVKDRLHVDGSSGRVV